MSRSERSVAAQLVVRDLLRMIPPSEALDEAAIRRLERAIETLADGHTGTPVSGERFPPELVGTESREGKPFVFRDGVLRTARIAAYEEEVERQLHARSGTLPRSAAADEALERLFPVVHGELRETEPRHAAETVLGGRISFVVGGPGRGKTYTLKLLLAVLFEEAAALGMPPPKVKLAAPTGKAAARMREAIGEDLDKVACDQAVKDALRALEARTLHRLLGLNPARALDRDKRPPRPVDADVVIVDEASMIDLPLFARLLAQVPSDARLVLLGDPDQLASVGVGSVLADLVRGDEHGTRTEAVPGLSARVARLTVSHRFGPDSGIAKLAEAIGRESSDEVEDVLRGEHEDLTHLEDEAAEWAALREAVVEGFRGVSEALSESTDDAALARALAAFDAHRILALTYDGRFGVDALNARAAEWLVHEGLVERLDDEVSIHPVLVTENDPDTGLMNGDVGLVLTLDEQRVAVFPDLESPVKRVPAALLPAHATAFAMTVHKAQGSQFDHVSLVFPKSESRLATRELFYTGVTRAKRRLTLHGAMPRLKSAAENRELRISGLRERLHPRVR
jgi:exodeoxyribonuclease V alpha subunit